VTPGLPVPSKRSKAGKQLARLPRLSHLALEVLPMHISAVLDIIESRFEALPVPGDKCKLARVEIYTASHSVRSSGDTEHYADGVTRGEKDRVERFREAGLKITTFHNSTVYDRDGEPVYLYR
jgi:hypothetical protein